MQSQRWRERAQDGKRDRAEAGADCIKREEGKKKVRCSSRRRRSKGKCILKIERWTSSKRAATHPAVCATAAPNPLFEERLSHHLCRSVPSRELYAEGKRRKRQRMARGKAQAKLAAEKAFRAQGRRKPTTIHHSPIHLLMRKQIQTNGFYPSRARTQNNKTGDEKKTNNGSKEKMGARALSSMTFARLAVIQ